MRQNGRGDFRSGIPPDTGRYLLHQIRNAAQQMASAAIPNAGDELSEDGDDQAGQQHDYGDADENVNRSQHHIFSSDFARRFQRFRGGCASVDQDTLNMAGLYHSMNRRLLDRRSGLRPAAPGYDLIVKESRELRAHEKGAYANRSHFSDVAAGVTLSVDARGQSSQDAVGFSGGGYGFYRR